MSHIDLVIFDCDGVLVDSEDISNRVLAEALTRDGLPTTLQDARDRYQGLLLSDMMSRVEATRGRPLPDGWLDQFERDRSDAFRRELAAVPGAAEALARLSAAGVPICIASQGKLEKTRLSLDLTGLRRFFTDDAVFSAHLVPLGKPHPDLFLRAARRMGADATRCTVVEDSPLGVQGAVAAGMRALGYCATGNAAALAEAGAELLESLDELPPRLGL